MVGWHHELYEFEPAPGVVMDREPWRAAVHPSLWGHKESDTTE